MQSPNLPGSGSPSSHSGARPQYFLLSHDSIYFATRLFSFTICVPYLNQIPASLQNKLDTHQEQACPYQSRPSVARLYLASGMASAI